MGTFSVFTLRWCVDSLARSSVALIEIFCVLNLHYAMSNYGRVCKHLNCYFLSTIPTLLFGFFFLPLHLFVVFRQKGWQRCFWTICKPCIIHFWALSHHISSKEKTTCIVSWELYCYPYRSAFKCCVLKNWTSHRLRATRMMGGAVCNETKRKKEWIFTFYSSGSWQGNYTADEVMETLQKESVKVLDKAQDRKSVV